MKDFGKYLKSEDYILRNCILVTNARLTLLHLSVWVIWFVNSFQIPLVMSSMTFLLGLTLALKLKELVRYEVGQVERVLGKDILIMVISRVVTISIILNIISLPELENSFELVRISIGIVVSLVVVMLIDGVDNVTHDIMRYKSFPKLKVFTMDGLASVGIRLTYALLTLAVVFILKVLGVDVLSSLSTMVLYTAISIIIGHLIKW